MNQTDTKIYFYDPVTLEYTHSATPDLDPVATQRVGHPIILVPANGTPKVPPTNVGEHQVAVFKNDKWVKMSDYRNCYTVDKSMNIYLQTELGELPEGYVVITEEQHKDILEDSLKYKWSKDGLIKNPDYDKDKKSLDLNKKKNEILAQLDTIDLKSIRAIRAGDTEYLAKYEEEAKELRKQLKELN